MVNSPDIGSSLPSAASNIMKQDGFVRGFYSGFVPILFKQIPYTMAKFAVQGWASEKMCAGLSIDLGAATTSGATKTGVALSSGVVAGVVAAIISHPADTLLSLVNKPGRGGDGSIVSRLIKISGEEGLALAYKGLPARCVMIGTLTAGQFAIFDNIMAATGAKKFHFHEPSKA
jgi:solute carrier family 25 phosphate transporter 3